MMKKFLLNVGAEKAGTTWLYNYFKNHPDFHDLGKEWNSIQRDDLVPTHGIKYYSFKDDLESYFDTISAIPKVTGDFTHYEGSTPNIYKLLIDGLQSRNIEVVPVYIMRDPIDRAWSCWNMLGGGDYSNLPAAAHLLTKNYLNCKYKETIEALNLISSPLYFFYESFFKQESLDTICDALNISRVAANTATYVNKGRYSERVPSSFTEKFGTTAKNIEAVRYISENFKDVPWNIENYTAGNYT